MRIKQSTAPSKSCKHQHGWKRMEGGGGKGQREVSQPEPRSQSCSWELRSRKEWDTSTAQITCGACEGGSLQVSGLWGEICWHAEAAAAHSYISTCSSWAGSLLGSNMSQGSRQRAASFSHRNQDTDRVLRWPAILLIHTLIHEDLSYGWWQILSPAEGLTCHTNSTCFICGLLSKDWAVSRSHEGPS